jgi:hypothetical protein
LRMRRLQRRQKLLLSRRR